MIKVLFVCLGNICRSPMAEALFQDMVDAARLTDVFEIDSAGLGSWHIGETAHAGTRQVLASNNISYGGQARVITRADTRDQTAYIVAMDAENIRDLRRRFGEIPRLYRLLDFAADTDERDVPDPYYDGNFEGVFELVEAGCRGLLGYITEQEELRI